MLNNDEIKNIAKLAGLKVTDSEIRKYKDDLDEIVNLFDIIEKFEFSERELEQVLNACDLREDISKVPLTKLEVFRNSSNISGDYFVVKGVKDSK